VGREAESGQRVGWLQREAPGPRQVLDSLDTHRMRHSLDHFPQHAPLEPVNPFTDTDDPSGGTEEGKEEVGESVYDPAFLLPLISHLLDPAGVADCRAVVRSGAVSYLLVALSSHREDVRKAAAHCLSRYSTHLRSSPAREKPQLSLLLRVVKNTLDESPQRLPSLHSCFCARVARVFLEPELPLYLVAGHYLVHKPALELRDIPLFNTLLLHPTTEQCGECVWLLEVLGAGLRCPEDYRLYQRKKVLPHLMGLYTAPSLDSKAKALILEVVLRACSFPVAVSDLVWNHALLAWLSLVSSCGSLSVVRGILSTVCRVVEGGKRGGDGSGAAQKLPPLLEEELSLTAHRLFTVS
jgi:hypothetical protein